MHPQGADHKHRGHQQDQAIVLGRQPAIIAERDQQAIPGDRHTNILAGEIDHIEAGQPEKTTQDKEYEHNGAPAMRCGIRIGKHRRSHPKPDDIRQRIELLPERMRGAEPAPDLPIQIIPDDRAEHQQDSQGKPASDSAERREYPAGGIE